ncbi:uncharacterized protein JCM10292_004224 [Rhodotorula paludigena]|uniref:uncharacterized protein n=1 Tax=Rhodotorula paludigena TaxID=86838 RepID=UPI00316F3216
MPTDNHGQSYSYSGSGTNDQGNHYCSRDFDNGSSGYHCASRSTPSRSPFPRSSRAPPTFADSNSDGSYYYSNSDGSTYYNSGDGYSNYTSSDGTSHQSYGQK